MAKKPSKKTTKNESDVNKALIKNFVALQKVLTNLSTKLDSLNDEISKLLELFEISAKSFADKVKQGEIGKQELGKEGKKLSEKLDTLLDQNKTIAKGLVLMQEKMQKEPEPITDSSFNNNEDFSHRPRPRPFSSP